MFHLLYRFSPAIRTEFGRSEEGRWIQRYGFEEHTIGKDDDESVEDGRFSRRRRYRKVVRERPGLAPAALFHLIGNSVFLRLSDVASGLPSYEEQVMLCPMDSEPDSYGYTQWGAYGTLYDKLRAALADALAKGSRKLLSTYLQSLLAYPDGCTRGETVRDGLRSILDAHPDIEVVGEAANGLEAISRVEELQPDVVLMDAQMPEMDGIESTRHIKEQWPDTKILFLTVHTDFIQAAVAAGADAYLLKDSGRQELLQAIRDLGSRG